MFKSKIFSVGALLTILAISIGFRFYHITEPNFVYYDEGMWLNHNRDLVHLIDQNPPKNLTETFFIVKTCFKYSLETAKPLWSFLSSLRGLFYGDDGLFFTRLISAIFGVASILLVYLFGKRFYESEAVGLLAALSLALLPSHVYYSRIGLQESISAFLFLSGLYLYIFSRRFHWKSLLAGFVWGLVFFVNYRMAIIPVFIVFVELYLAWAEKKQIEWRRLVYSILVFLATIFLIGNLNEGRNTFISFAWIFHQSNLAKGHFELFNLASYPYYLFALETYLFGGFFFLLPYLLWKKVEGNRAWREALPFFCIVLQMIIFSFPQEKAVRYLCVMMPLMSLTVAYVITTLPRVLSIQKSKVVISIFAVILFVHQTIATLDILTFQSAYAASMKEIQAQEQNVKVLSSQAQVQTLFAPKKSVQELQRSYNLLVAAYLQGFRYLIMDPQVYVSFTENKQRFTLKLEGPLQFVQTHVEPVKEYAHFSPSLLQRFVLDHNESLSQSLHFLRSNEDGSLGKLRVYKIEDCIKQIRTMLSGKKL